MTDTGEITWLRVPGDEEIPDDVRELWAVPLEKLGFVPNVFRTMALRPSHLVRWEAYFDDLMRGDSGLTKAQREMIAVVVSAHNRCHYCLVSHCAVLRKLTGDPTLVEQLATNYRYATVEPRERAMLDYAVKLTGESSACTRDDLEALRDVGWSDEDILDIAEVAAMFNYTNRLASGLGWQPNPEYFTLGR
jgi:uncharacterized peroxidase-related enzyme